MAPLSKSTSPSSNTSAGIRPTGFIRRTSSRFCQAVRGLLSNGIPSSFRLTATRRVNGDIYRPINSIALSLYGNEKHAGNAGPPRRTRHSRFSNSSSGLGKPE